MKYPPEHFMLEEALLPAMTCVALCRIEGGYPESIVRRLGSIQSLLFELVDDDLLGLIDATPEERVRLATEIAEAGHV